MNAQDIPFRGKRRKRKSFSLQDVLDLEGTQVNGSSLLGFSMALSAPPGEKLKFIRLINLAISTGSSGSHYPSFVCLFFSGSLSSR